MKTYVVSGAASGIGAATAALLREQGGRVITVDLHDADVTADLGTAEGRAEAVAGVRELTEQVQRARHREPFVALQPAIERVAVGVLHR